MRGIYSRSIAGELLYIYRGSFIDKDIDNNILHSLILLLAATPCLAVAPCRKGPGYYSLLLLLVVVPYRKGPGYCSLLLLFAVETCFCCCSLLLILVAEDRDITSCCCFLLLLLVVVPCCKKPGTPPKNFSLSAVFSKRPLAVSSFSFSFSCSCRWKTRRFSSALVHIRSASLSIYIQQFLYDLRKGSLYIHTVLVVDC